MLTLRNWIGAPQESSRSRESVVLTVVGLAGSSRQSGASSS